MSGIYKTSNGVILSLPVIHYRELCEAILGLVWIC